MNIPSIQLDSLNNAEVLAIAGALFLLGTLAQHLRRQISFELVFQGFLTDTAAFLTNEGSVTQLRQGTLDFFANNAASSVISERHTTEFLELIVSSGCRSANQELARMASELAALGVPLDSSLLPQLFFRSQDVARLRKGQCPIRHSRCERRSPWLMLQALILAAVRVTYCEAKQALRLISRDPATCLLTLAM